MTIQPDRTPHRQKAISYQPKKSSSVALRATELLFC